MQETQVWPLGWDDPLEKGMGKPLHYSCLENSMHRGAWWATVHGVTKSLTRVSNWHTHTHIHILHIYLYSLLSLLLINRNYIYMLDGSILWLGITVGNWSIVYLKNVKKLLLCSPSKQPSTLSSKPRTRRPARGGATHSSKAIPNSKALPNSSPSKQQSNTQHLGSLCNSLDYKYGKKMNKGRWWRKTCINSCFKESRVLGIRTSKLSVIKTPS